MALLLLCGGVSCRCCHMLCWLLRLLPLLLLQHSLCRDDALSSAAVDCEVVQLQPHGLVTEGVDHRLNTLHLLPHPLLLLGAQGCGLLCAHTASSCLLLLLA